MKPAIYLPICLSVLLIPLLTVAQNEPFQLIELNQKFGSGTYRLAHPFDIVYGQDNHLYITEKVGRIIRVDTGTGIRQIILDIRNKVKLNINRSGGVATSIGQNGMLGLALHPGFATVPGKDSLYVAYCYDWDHIRISRFYFNGTNIPAASETVLLENIPAGGDHSSGRLIVGADQKLYYSCGDLGHNQFGNTCEEIRSQKLPTAGNISAENFDNYSGKVLRINMDGSIPGDNPLWQGVQSHIYTVGHRNPQGLVWEKNTSNGVAFPVLNPAGKLFSAEHGPNSDDELNILEAGRNYGWPHIAGDTDNVNFRYVRWFTATNCNPNNFVEDPYHNPAGAQISEEKDAPLVVKNNFRKPIKSIYRDCGSLPQTRCRLAGNWLRFPTIGPSSIEYYNLNLHKGIPGWYPSLLVTTLKTGALFRFKLNAAQNAIVGDSITYFKAIDRYRDIALSPDGKIFMITDSIGSTSGPSGQNQSTMQHPGSIMVATYTGATILSVPDRNTPGPDGSNPYLITVYPNPARQYIHIDFGRMIHKPVRYRLYNMIGSLALEGSSTKDDFNFYVRDLQRGMYILKLYNKLGIEVWMQKMLLTN